MRICPVCGEPMFSGMTNDDGDFYVHENCFKEFMDNEFGEGNWKSLSDDPDWDGNCDESGGYYIYKEDDSDKWYSTGIYYTEYFDDEEYEGECL